MKYLEDTYIDIDSSRSRHKNMDRKVADISGKISIFRYTYVTSPFLLRNLITWCFSFAYYICAIRTIDLPIDSSQIGPFKSDKFHSEHPAQLYKNYYNQTYRQHSDQFSSRTDTVKPSARFFHVPRLLTWNKQPTEIFNGAFASFAHFIISFLNSI